MAKDWRSAYLRQASSDYESLNLLLTYNADTCQCLHYLQMATEKLAKGFLTPIGGARQPAVHSAFVKFLRLVNRDSNLRQLCDCGQSQVKAYVDSLLSIAYEIEDLAPSGLRDKPNPEYPWEARTPVGIEIFVPVDYHFSSLAFTNSRMLKLLKFIDRCFRMVEND